MKVGCRNGLGKHYGGVRSACTVYLWPGELALLTLPVDPQCVQQLGATELSAEQGSIQLRQARNGTLRWVDITVPSFRHGATQNLQGVGLGQHAVNKVDPGPAHHVQQSVLEEANGWLGILLQKQGHF